MTELVRMQIQIPRTLANRLTEVASVRQISIDALVKEAIEAVLPVAQKTDTLLAPQKNSYRWKDVLLPNETLLSFQYKGATYTAAVKNGEILYENRPVSPSEFINSISNGVRNAWRDIWVKRPLDHAWLPASEVRAESMTAKLAKMENGSPESDDTFTVSVAPDHSSQLAGAPVAGRRQFGTLRVSERMGPRYLKACVGVVQIIVSQTASSTDLEQISEAKGMFNRIVRRDRHDWMHVQELLGMPNLATCRQAAAWLTELRALVTDDLPLDSHCTRPAATAVQGALQTAKAALQRDGFGLPESLS